MAVDDEPAADQQQLQELVRKQSEAATKKLQQQLQSLRQQVARLGDSKNYTRGPNTNQKKNSGASMKKENGNRQAVSRKKSKSPRSNRKPNDRKAEDADNDTDNKKQRSRSNQTFKRKSGEKNNNNSKGNNKRRGRSKGRSN